MRPSREDLSRLRDELLLDASTIGLAPHEQRVLDLLSKILAGSVLLWISVTELLAEIARYRDYRARTKHVAIRPAEPGEPGQ